MATSMSPLLNLPAEIFDDIAFNVVIDDQKPALGPPSQLIPLLLASKSLSRRLQNSALRARIFKAQFDSSAIQRRAFKPTSYDYAEQLVYYWRALRTVRRQIIYDEEQDDADEIAMDVDTTLIAVHLMLLEDDGKGSAQLHALNAYQWLQKLVLTRLYENAENGWPVDCLRNSLALWNMWMLTREKDLAGQTLQENQHMRRMLLPMATFAPRYPTAFVPANHFHLPLPPDHHNNSHATSIPTSHGPYPAYFAPEPRIVFHYRPDFQLYCPPSAPAAKLLYFAWRERYPIGIPHVFPVSREDAIERFGHEDGSTRLTQNDLHEWNGHGPLVHPSFRGGTVLPPVKEWGDGIEWSRGYDADFYRLVMCSGQETTSVGGPLRVRMGSVYTPGSMSGLWAGRMFWFDTESHRSLFSQPPRQPGPPPLPSNFSEDFLVLAPASVYMRMQEHAVFAPGRVIPCGGPKPVTYIQENTTDSGQDNVFDQGLLHGWLPQSMQWRRVTSFMYPETEEQKPNTNATNAYCFGVGAEPALKAEQTVEIEFERDHTAPQWDGMKDEFIYQTLAPLPLMKELSSPLQERVDPVPSVAGTLSSQDAGSLSSGPPQVAVTEGEDQEVVASEVVSSAILPDTKAAPTGKAPPALPREPGRFHDHDHCPGCIVREEHARNLRIAQSVDLDNDSFSSSSQLQPSSDDETEDDSDSDADSLVDAPHSIDPWAFQPIENLDCPGILDVILTGSTDIRHGAAWHPYVYQGRVRPYDGLIAILRTPTVSLDNSNGNTNDRYATEEQRENVRANGRVVFYGYLIGGRNFVGNYRSVATGDVSLPGWEGAFSLGRRE